MIPTRYILPFICFFIPFMGSLRSAVLLVLILSGTVDFPPPQQLWYTIAVSLVWVLTIVLAVAYIRREIKKEKLRSFF